MCSPNAEEPGSGQEGRNVRIGATQLRMWQNIVLFVDTEDSEGTACGKEIEFEFDANLKNKHSRFQLFL